MKKLSVILAVLLLFFGCDRKENTKAINMDKDLNFHITKGEDKISNITLNDNKVLVLNFFTSTCGGCKEELPGMVKMQKSMGEKVNFIGVLGEKIDKKSALKFLSGYNINFPVINKSKTVQVLSDAIGGVFGVPVTVVFGKDGKVVKKFLGVVPTSILRKNVLANM